MGTGGLRGWTLRKAAALLDRGNAAVRRRMAVEGAVSVGTRLVVSPPPPVTTLERNPEAGLEFIEDRIKARTGVDSSASPRERVSGMPWYHTVDLGDDVYTPGFFDHAALVPHYGIPDDLDGWRVLDAGSGDGFWSFEFERRGAKVTALDIPDTDHVDLPSPVRRLAEDRSLTDDLRGGIRLAAELRGSAIDIVDGNIYDLGPEFGSFDLVHAGDILLHLREPLRALEALRSVTVGRALLADVFDPALQGPTSLHYLGGWHTAGWWVPSLDALVQMVRDAGFAHVDVHTTYQLPPVDLPGNIWRGVLQAYAEEKV